MDKEQYMQSQQTVYVLKGSKRLKTYTEDRELIAGEGAPLGPDDIPFLRLLRGVEPLEYCHMRYSLFEKSRQRQELTIKNILQDLSHAASREIETVIRQPLSSYLDTCLLLSNSTISTSFVFLGQLSTFLNSYDHYKVISLNSKEATTMKLALKTVVESITGDLTDELSDDAADDEVRTFDKRYPWDLEIVQEWCEALWQRTSQDINSSKLRIILVFEDIESFNISLLNRFIKLLNSYNDRIPFKLIFNVGTNVQTFAQKLSNEVSQMLQFHKFNIEQTDRIINRVVSDIVIKDDLLIGDELAQFILNRFKQSIKTVNEFIKIITYCKMIHFFANPLSVLPTLQEDQIKALPTEYIKALRMLPTFKKYVYSLVRLDRRDKVRPLLEDDHAVAELFIKATNLYSDYTTQLKCLFEILTDVIIQRSSTAEKSYMEFYFNMVSEDEFLRLQFINEVISMIKSFSIDDIQEILAEIYEISTGSDFVHGLYSKLKTRIDLTILDEFQGDSYEEKQHLKIESRKIVGAFVAVWDNFLRENIRGPEKILFNEVFKLSYDDVVKNNLVPSTKDTIQESLLNPEIYLGSSTTGHTVLDRLNNSIAPMITDMFTTYRETTLDLNIYDYYVAFKQSLNKEEILKDINLILDDEHNILETYLNDELRFKYIYQFFNDTAFSNDYKWDRLTLTFFLQKCEELVYCGFFKQRSNTSKKAGSLEKAIWKDL